MAACTSGAPGDPCDGHAVVPGGAVELGLGDTFTPVHKGQDVELEHGGQGLTMFVVNARVQGMDASAGDLGVLLDAVDGNGNRASLYAPACRTRQFEDDGSGALQPTTGLLLPLDCKAVAIFNGATFTIRIEVRDVDGRRATDERTVVAHLP